MKTDTDTGDGRKTSAKRPKKTPSPASAEQRIDEMLRESFPASDPPAWGSPRRAQRREDAAQEEGDAQDGAQGEGPPAKSDA